MSYQKFLDKVQNKKDIIILGKFKNDYEELFVLYRNIKKGKLYISGDELDWELFKEWQQNRYIGDCSKPEKLFIMTLSETIQAFLTLEEYILRFKK